MSKTFCCCRIKKKTIKKKTSNAYGYLVAAAEALMIFLFYLFNSVDPFNRHAHIRAGQNAHHMRTCVSPRASAMVAFSSPSFMILSFFLSCWRVFIKTAVWRHLCAQVFHKNRMGTARTDRVLNR